MKLRERLKTPSALVFQGFAAGALLFYGLHPLAEPGREAEAPARGSVLDTLEA